ncbi:MAG: hypothetical protein GDA41_05690 [Rhodospirillales bacterium]|nr:hypothetical protein [Rhodospirillales bacterium]
MARRGSQYGAPGSGKIAGKMTLVYVVLGLLALSVGGLYALTFEMEPASQAVEKVFPDDRFPR